MLASVVYFQWGTPFFLRAATHGSTGWRPGCMQVGPDGQARILVRAEYEAGYGSCAERKPTGRREIESQGAAQVAYG